MKIILRNCNIVFEKTKEYDFTERQLYFSNGETTWGDEYKCFLIDVTGASSITIERSVNNQAIAFMKEYKIPQKGDTIDFCDGYTTQQPLDFPSKTFNLPSDCKMVWVQTEAYGSPSHIEAKPKMIKLDDKVIYTKP